MRADMSKVLVERPRLGVKSRRVRKKGYRRALARDVDAERELPRERITALRGNTTHFNEHLGPLRRFLNARVGRHWDAVYSELCEHIDRGNVVQKHILTHLFHYVEVHAVLVDGVPHHPHGHRKGPLPPIRGRYRWYVCPKSGLLKRAKNESNAEARERWLPKPPPPPMQVWVGKSELVRRWPDGRWEMLTMRPIRAQPGAAPATATQLDTATGRWIDRETAVQLYGRPMFCVEVRPLKAHEWKNLPIPIDLLRQSRGGPNVVR